MKNYQARFASLSLLAFCAIGALMIAGTEAVAQNNADETVSAVGAPPFEGTPGGPDETAMPLPADVPLTGASVGSAEIPAAPVSNNGTSQAASPATPSAAALTIPSAPAGSPAAPAAQPVSAQPPATPLQQAQPAPSQIPPIPGEVSGASSGNAMGATDARTRHSGTYYDSNARVPNADLSAAGVTGPRKVDPALEPAQTFVTVEKGKSASSFEGRYVAATRALKLGRYAAAMDLFSQLQTQSPKDPRILLGLGLAQQGAGSTESARRTYEELLRVQPNNATAIINLIGLSKDQNPSVTISKLEELRQKYPDNPGVPAQIGLVNADMQNYDEAIKYLQIAASMDPQNPSHIFNMAIVADRKGDTRNALTLYEQALQADASYANAADALPRDQIYDRLVVLRRKI